MNIRSLRVIHFINHFIELHENESEASENISFTKKVLIQEICDCCYGNLFFSVQIFIYICVRYMTTCNKNVIYFYHVFCIVISGLYRLRNIRIGINLAI